MRWADLGGARGGGSSRCRSRRRAGLPGPFEGGGGGEGGGEGREQEGIDAGERGRRGKERKGSEERSRGSNGDVGGGRASSSLRFGDSMTAALSCLIPVMMFAQELSCQEMQLARQHLSPHPCDNTAE